MSKWQGRVLWNEVFKVVAILGCLVGLVGLARLAQGYWDSRVVKPHRLHEAIALDKCMMAEAKNVLDNKTVITVGILSNIQDICEKDPDHNLDKQREIFVVAEEKRKK